MKARTRAGIALGLAVALIAIAPLAARDDKPQKTKDKKLSDSERREILDLIRLVDRASLGERAAAEAPPWARYTFKATEGMGYVPLRMGFATEPDAFKSAAIYLRVVSRRKDGSRAAERSGLEQWLNQDSLRGIPRPVRGFIYVNPDEMPMGGPTAGSRRPVINSAQGSSTTLGLMVKENQESKGSGGDKAATKDERHAKRDETNDEEDAFLFPFEDFDFVDFTANTDVGQGGARHIDRAVAIPSGSYDVFLALRERPGHGKNLPAPRATVYRQPIDVPDLSAGFSLSSVIVTDHLGTLSVPYAPEQQSAHPFALGWTEAMPASDDRFSDTEELGIVFQVLNATPDPRRKPDVTVEYTFYRRSSTGEARLTSARQDYNRTTLPPEFDLIAGHQLLAAQAVPLKAFPPGDYRLELNVTDRRASKKVKADVAFTVVASPGSLWVSRTVQALLTPAFRSDEGLRPEMVGDALDALESYQAKSAPTEGLAAVVAVARDGQFASLLTQLPALNGQEPTAAFLRGLALLGLNGGFEPAALQFRSAVARAPDFQPAALYLGIAEAAQGRDREAIDAWMPGLRVQGNGNPALIRLMAEAHLRLNKISEAVALLQKGSDEWPDDALIAKRLAASHILARDYPAAFTGLEHYLARHGDDVDALFLALHLLHQTRIGGPDLGGEVRASEKMAAYAHAYARENGPHQVVVAQWLSELEAGAP